MTLSSDDDCSRSLVMRGGGDSARDAPSRDDEGEGEGEGGCWSWGSSDAMAR